MVQLSQNIDILKSQQFDERHTYEVPFTYLYHLFTIYTLRLQCCNVICLLR